MSERSLILEWLEKKPESHVASCGSMKVGVDLVGGKWLYWASINDKTIKGWEKEYSTLLDAQRAAERYALSIYNGMKRDLPYQSYKPVGYMCKVDFDHEVGYAMGGNIIYPSAEDCVEWRKCTDSCGLVKVQLKYIATVKRAHEDEA